jgi:dihydrofolate reductase
MNAIPKFFASTTLERGDEWHNSTLITGDVPSEVARLKQRHGSDILIYGCGRLARTLTEHDLIDEFRIWVAPLVIGTGTRLFDGPAGPIALRLTATTVFEVGTVLLTSAPAAKDWEASVRTAPEPPG